MKKILFSVLAAISALSAFAQADTAYAKEATSLKYKAEPNRFGVEAGINLKDGFSINGGRINAIYSLNEKLAVRCGFSLDQTKTYKHDDIIDDEENTEDDTKKITMRTDFEVLPGIVYSFKGTERLEPYIGAEVVFGFGKDRERTKGNHSGYDDTDKEGLAKKNYEASSKKTETNLFFGANGFTGFNFYLCKDLFIGAELGFGFITTPDVVENVSGEDSRVEAEDEKEDKSKHFYHTTKIDLNFHPTVRLGWKF